MGSVITKKTTRPDGSVVLSETGIAVEPSDLKTSVDVSKGTAAPPKLGIGGAPDDSAILDLQSTTKGFLPPRMTTVQIDAIAAPVEGLVVFDTTKKSLRLFKNGAWCYVTCGIVTGQFSDGADQLPVVLTPVVITFNKNDIVLDGIEHSETVNPEEFKATIAKPYTFMLAPQWTAAATGETIDFFVQIDTGGGFVNVANSNIKVFTAAASSNVAPLMLTLNLAVNDKVRFMQRISDVGKSLGIKFTAAEVGPPAIPATPSVILTVFSGD